MSQTERFRPYAAVYLVLKKDGQVLLLRRYNTGFQDGNYSLVAGHFDGGETAKQCIIREALEEANLSLNPDDLEIVHVMHQIRLDREYFDVYLQTEKWAGEITILEPNKCDELNWFKLDELPDNILPNVKLALEDIIKNIHYSEFNWTA